jgi:nicotinate-nucleotide--dimethylbenzimidazole phosphoribosyltransferase
MTCLQDTCARIGPIDRSAGARAQRLLDAKTKPRRSLGRLEDLACILAAIRRSTEIPVPTKAIVIMAGDHGVAEEGVSAYPQEVTHQMLANFAHGGAAINVLARHVGARIVVVDTGVKEPLPQADGIRVHRLGPGTCNFTHGPAMAHDQAVAGLELGIAIADELADEGVTLLGIGDMGIGNTTASSALTCALMRAVPEEVTGRGTGIDDEAWCRKVAAIRRGLVVNRPQHSDPLDVLAKLGGFEIAGLAGVVIGGAARCVPLVVDGFIATIAALVAVRFAPRARDYLIASHRSVEVGHGRVLDALRLQPLLDLDLRLGEGTGAALAMPLIDASVRLLREMATFAEAGVTDSEALG